MARERLLVNAGKDTIHENIITADTPKAKLQNWWYYHKVIVIAVVCAVAVFVSILWSIFGRVKPDYTVAILNTFEIDHEALELLGDHIALYGEDLNGDGEVIVDVYDYYFFISDEADTELADNVFESASVKYAANMASANSMIWLYDDYGISAIGNTQEIFAPITLPDGSSAEGIEWENVPGLVCVDLESYENEILTPKNIHEAFSQFTVAIRAKENSSFENDAELLEYYEANQRLLNNLLTNTKRTAE